MIYVFSAIFMCLDTSLPMHRLTKNLTPRKGHMCFFQTLLACDSLNAPISQEGRGKRGEGERKRKKRKKRKGKKRKGMNKKKQGDEGKGIVFGSIFGREIRIQEINSNKKKAS